MKQNFLYISPEFPVNFQNFVMELDKEGVNVLGVGHSDFNHMPEDLRRSMKWYINTNLDNYNDFSNAVSYMMNQTGIDRIDCVESHNEHWLHLESMTNEKFDIDGVKSKKLSMWKRKSIMKHVFMKNNIPHAKGKLLKNREEAFVLANQLGYPVILKPDIGVGAQGVYKIKNEKELKHILKNINNEPYILEEFLEGKLVSYDGLVNSNGKIIFENSFSYSSGVLDFVHGTDPACVITPNIPKKLSSIGTTLVEIFDIKKKFFHFEFFNHDGKYTPIEVNVRPPGGHILDMMNYSMDDNLYNAYAKMIAGKKVSLKKKKYYCGFVGRRDKNYKYSHEDIIQKFQDQLVSHFTPPKLYHEAMGKRIYVFRNTCKNRINELKNLLTETS
ncbi:MAG: ATP-grasp domain-containing protein [Bacteriovoracaceae bacterium]|nr:ATP-grasp domain-containing protein [Bacteriovoracaceae bacterium]